MKLVLGPSETTLLTADGRGISGNSTYLARAFFGQSALDVDLLPPAVRWVSARSDAFIVERPPSYQTITYRSTTDIRDGKEHQEFTIPTPWTVWGIKLNSDALGGVQAVYVMARPMPITNSSDTLFQVRLPNIGHSNDKICVPPRLEATPFKNVADAINQCISTFWTSPFNDDLVARMQPVWDEYGSIYKYFEHLQERTLDQAMEDLSEESFEHSTVQSLINKLSKETQPVTSTMEFFKQMIQRSNGQ